jgi:hypothetical protein
MNGTQKIAAALRRYPRLSSALAFGAAGGLLSTAWWTPLIFRGGLLEWNLFIGTPALAAMFAASLLGRPLLTGRSGIKRAALRGVLIGSVALLLFAPLFSGAYVYTQPAEHWDVFGLAVMILIGSAVVIWWLVAIVSAAVASILYWFCR